MARSGIQSARVRHKNDSSVISIADSLPDVLARPTKAGIAAGRDEVLEAALTYLDGVAK